VLHQDENEWPRIRKELIRQIKSRSEFYSTHMLLQDIPRVLKQIEFEDEDEQCDPDN